MNYSRLRDAFLIHRVGILVVFLDVLEVRFNSNSGGLYVCNPAGAQQTQTRLNSSLR